MSNRKSRKSRQSKKSKKQKRYSREKCGSGKIERAGYYRKDNTYVEPKCIPDVGEVGHGPNTLPSIIEEFSLRSDYGYTTKLLESSRHRSLDKAIRDLGHLPVLKHLILRANYNPDPESKAIMYLDSDYISDSYRNYQISRGEQPSQYRYSRKARLTRKKMLEKIENLEREKISRQSGRFRRSKRLSHSLKRLRSRI